MPGVPAEELFQSKGWIFVADTLKPGSKLHLRSGGCWQAGAARGLSRPTLAAGQVSLPAASAET